jgi:hypothetical protein
MARIRTIKPELPQSQSIGRLSRDARLLFIQLFTVADDAGRARAASRLLASLLYPYDDDAPALIEGWLAELEQQKQIRRYVVDGSEYLEIVKWLEHQKIDRPSPSRLPEYRDASQSPREASRGLDADLGPVPVPRKGEGPQLARSDLKVVEEDKPTRIDETYEPSDRAVEYAFSLGMKKADLNSELSKFIATSMATRAVSFNIDMSFKKWCDHWLEFKLKKDPAWKPESAAAPAVEDHRPIIVDGTNEHVCWNTYNREHGLRPLFMCKQIRPDGTIIPKGARCDTLYPPGFNDFGERIEPASEDAA